MRLRSRTYVTDGALRTENKVLQVLEVLSQPKPLPLLPAIQVDQELIPLLQARKRRGSALTIDDSDQRSEWSAGKSKFLRLTYKSASRIDGGSVSKSWQSRHH